jgi:hypothetical protein
MYKAPISRLAGPSAWHLLSLTWYVPSLLMTPPFSTTPSAPTSTMSTLKGEFTGGQELTHLVQVPRAGVQQSTFLNTSAWWGAILGDACTLLSAYPLLS